MLTLHLKELLFGLKNLLLLDIFSFHIGLLNYSISASFENKTGN